MTSCVSSDAGVGQAASALDIRRGSNCHRGTMITNARLLQRISFFAVFCMSLAVLPRVASAGSISITTGPTSATSGSVTENSQTFMFVPVSSDLVKIIGVGDYTATGATSQITLTAGGLISAEAGEVFSLDYEFTFNFTGAGELNWEITSLLQGIIPGPDASGGPITSGESGFFSGNASEAAPLALNNAIWSAELAIDWTGATAGDTLTVTIPNDSIDLAVVPEPSSMLLLGLGSLFLFRRRR